MTEDAPTTPDTTPAVLDTDVPDTAKPAVADDDDMHRRFREALDRKKSPQQRGATGGPTSGPGVGPSNNSKTTRQFRRKSGGGG